MGKNVIMFGVDTSSSVHIDNKGKDILILGEEPTQELHDTTLTAEGIYPLNFTQPNKRFVLSLTVSYLLILPKYISSKQKALKQNTIHCD